jgi:hypothetical protein
MEGLLGSGVAPVCPSAGSGVGSCPQAAAAGIATAIAGLLVTGFAISPIALNGLSVAARSAPDRAGQAVAAVTAVGYSSFLLIPLAVGALATPTDLRIGLGVVVATSLVVAGPGLRWPRAAAVMVPAAPRRAP